jgi:hypothetical protein
MAHVREIDEDVVKRRFDNDSDAACTLSIQELVTSAFVLYRTRTLSQGDIEDCIRGHHPYFRRLWASDNAARDPVIEQLSEDVVDYSHSLLAPLAIRELPDGDMAVSISSQAVNSLLKKFTTCNSSSPHPGKASSESDSFPFHKLPGELKLMVFRHLFAYPDFRLSFESFQQTAMFAYPITSAPDGWVEDPAWSYLRSLADLLGPLLVCNKEFSSLACMSFYGLNDFQCGDLATLKCFLKSMGPGGRACIKHITVRYHRLKEAREVVEMIEECTSLKSLALVFNIKHKHNGKIEVIDDKGHGKFTYAKPSVIPGLKKLKSIFMAERPKVLKITACSISECVEKVKMYMYQGVSGLT